MTPAQAATARPAGDRPVSGGRPVRAPQPAAPLSVVEAPSRRSRSGRRRRTELAALLVVTLSLLAVVLGHSMLAAGQVRLSTLQSELATAQARNQALALSVAQLETPARIVSQAEQTLHMVVPPAVQQLPSVPLATPLPAPHVLPAASTSGATAPAGGTTTATTGTTGR